MLATPEAEGEHPRPGATFAGDLCERDLGALGNLLPLHLTQGRENRQGELADRAPGVEQFAHRDQSPPPVVELLCEVQHVLRIPAEPVQLEGHDALSLAEHRLRDDHGVTEGDLDAIKADMKAISREAYAYADAQTEPDLRDLYAYTYAE